jgi:hypothetical protein
VRARIQENEMEHRWGERLSVGARVALRAPGGLQGIAYIRDVSVSGALLVCGVRASPMSFVRVFLPAGSSLSGKSLEGQVVRHTKDGFAVEWCELAPDVVRSLAQMDTAVVARIEREIPSMVRSVSAGR